MTKIIITVPDEAPLSEIEAYLDQVSSQIGQGYLSGHTSAEQHWTSEGRLT